jgi:hypothetical protein
VTLTTHDVGAPTTCSSDTTLHLLNAQGTQLALGSDSSGPGPGDPVTGGKCSQIASKMLAAGTYYAWVQSTNDAKLIPGYQLDLLVQ